MPYISLSAINCRDIQKHARLTLQQVLQYCLQNTAILVIDDIHLVFQAHLDREFHLRPVWPGHDYLDLGKIMNQLDHLLHGSGTV